jgi:hypothetical protein
VSIGEQQTKRNIDWEAHLLWQQNSKPKKSGKTNTRTRSKHKFLRVARSSKQDTREKENGSAAREKSGSGPAPGHQWEKPDLTGALLKKKMENEKRPRD